MIAGHDVVKAVVMEAGARTRRKTGGPVLRFRRAAIRLGLEKIRVVVILI